MQEKIVHPMLVPYDFTPVSEVAIEHAARFAKMTGNPMVVLNIEDPGTKKYLRQHSQIDHYLKKQMWKICEKTSEKHKIEVSYIIQKGNVSSIRQIAVKLNIFMMFIGSDQPQWFASKVLKLVGRIPAPVYVVQDDIPLKGIKTIVYPVDEFEETRQKITCTIKLAKISNATVRLFPMKLHDRNTQFNQKVRVKQIENFLLEDKIPFTTEYAKLKEVEFADELIDYAKSCNADVFILMKTPRTFFPNLLISPFDKKVLLNSHNIPCIYVNPKDIGRYN